MKTYGLQRGKPGKVHLNAVAMYTVGAADVADEYPVVDDWISSELSLIDKDQKIIPVPKAKWHAGHLWTREGEVTLPDVPDGDYTLRVSYHTSLGQGQLEAPLALYAAARVHVITDRPLYEPGHQMKFRAVVLRAADLAPLDGRAGSWVVTDPSGEVVLEERAVAGAFGVVAGSFPIDKGAAVGTWNVAWRSHDASSQREVRVEPFTLPRFRVEAETPRPFYRAGEQPMVRGSVVYSSGAPVARAELELSYTKEGAWPLPSDWLAEKLPKKGVTLEDGRFELSLPKIPNDLLGQCTLMVHVTATDVAGDRVATRVPVLLSQDPIQASVVTELGDGLAEGFNNRMYVRVTTADGRVVENTKVTLKRSWQASDPGVEAMLDEDGVASLQIDPGPPVNVVIPPQPYRPPPPPEPVTYSVFPEIIGGQEAPLADQLAMDAWLEPLARCAKWSSREGASASVGLGVSESGGIHSVTGGSDALDACVVNLLRKQRLPAGQARMYGMLFSFAEPQLPLVQVTAQHTTDVPSGLVDKVASLLAGARDCLPNDVEGDLPEMVSFRAARRKHAVQLAWLKDPTGGDLEQAVACVAARLGREVTLDSEAHDDAIGLLRFSVAQPARAGQERPQPTVRPAYEFLVSVQASGSEETLTTKLIVEPGSVPDLRLRVTPVLANPGDTLHAELLRGPNYEGDPRTNLSEGLSMHCHHHQAQGKLDKQRRTKFKLPPEVHGWCEISGGGVRALAYVKPDIDLKVSVASERTRYAPGQHAQLEVQTSMGGKGGRAAVGLFGVDESLAQLTSLPGPSDIARVQPEVQTSRPAFGVLDGQALALGRIRGANAKAVTILGVGALPAIAESAASSDAEGATPFDALSELSDRFYAILPELYEQARVWESKAKASEKMTPATMVSLWEKALDACEKRKQSVADAFGRRLELKILPADLLALTDPRMVVSGTRLPEDVENWSAWVQKERN